MGVGLAVGIVGGIVLLQLIRRCAAPRPLALPPAVLLAAGVVYGIAAVAHGSGFLAVFVAGILVGEADYPRRSEVRHFHSALADLGELAVFVALGLTIDLGFIGSEGLWWRGLVLARPARVRGSGRSSWRRCSGARASRRRERLFVIWCGLKGAVPILLASLAVVGGTAYAPQIYGIVFVVVLFSVVVQGTAVPVVARYLGIPMAATEPD